MNPEFRRQLWLQFSPSRLILMPVLLLLGALVTGLSAQDQAADILASAAMLGFVALVYGMGTNAAGASILEEVQERTWDQQRLSAMQPWSMTWGKLAGATAYGWYGGSFCLLLFVPTALLAGWDQVPELVLAGVLGGVLLQALLLTINLQLGRNPSKLVQRGGAWVLFMLFVWAMGLGASLSRHGGIAWWGNAYDPLWFLLGSLLVFTPCVLIAAWRQMAESLAVRHLPWAWPALALVLTGYVGGFAELQSLPLSFVGLLVSAVFTYAALMSQPQARTVWQRVWSRVAARDWRAALQQLPLWFSSMVLVWPFAVLAGLSLAGGQAGLTASLGLGSQLPLIIGFLLLRDCCLLLFFSFNPLARRPHGAFMVTLLVLYVLLPWLLAVVGLTSLATVVFPLSSDAGFAGLVAALQGGAAALLLNWQWKKTRP